MAPSGGKSRPQASTSSTSSRTCQVRFAAVVPEPVPKLLHLPFCRQHRTHHPRTPLTAGWIRLMLGPGACSAGQTITFRHAELLQHPPYGPVDGNIYTGNLRSAQATDSYTCKGGEDRVDWQPMYVDRRQCTRAVCSPLHVTNQVHAARLPIRGGDGHGGAAHAGLRLGDQRALGGRAGRLHQVGETMYARWSCARRPVCCKSMTSPGRRRVHCCKSMPPGKL